MTAPLSVDVGAGVISRLAPLLADRRISSGGQVALAVGPITGRQVVEGIGDSLGRAALHVVEEGSVTVASDLARQLRAGDYDALVGIGGGRTLDVAKYAASLSGLPLVAVATSLAHDGIASPVASLEEEGHKQSFGVHMPIAVLVDLDHVRSSPARMRRAGVGDLLSNLAAIADWHLAERERGERVDGLAAAFASSAARAILDRHDGIDDEPFLSALAEALILSGLAMATAGSSRPCSGGEHEIVHAIDQLFPGTANHGELAGVATLFSFFLRGEEALCANIGRCLSQHGLPRTPQDLGLSPDQFAQAVSRAPATRPDRYTIIEHLDPSPTELGVRVAAFADAYAAR